MSDNHITICGNLTRDPEQRFTQGGTGVVNFGIASNRRYQSLLDRDRMRFMASVSRQLTPRLELRAQGSLNSSDYDSADQDDDETQLGLYLSWNATGRFFVELDVENFNRDSSNALTEYDETRAFLRLAWRNSGGASGAR